MRRSTRFTLIELLVVVAIIAILAAMLLPALTKSRDRATMTNCLAMVKQLYLGMSEYLSDDASKYPYAYFWDHQDADPYSYTFRWGDQYSSAHTGYTWNDHVYPYVRDPQVFQCPYQVKRRSGTYYIPGYTYNIYLGAGQYADPLSQTINASHVVPQIREEQVKKPENKVMFGDAAEGFRPGGTWTLGHPVGNFGWDMPRWAMPPGQGNSYPSWAIMNVGKHTGGIPVMFCAGNGGIISRDSDFGTPLTADNGTRTNRENKWLNYATN